MFWLADASMLAVPSHVQARSQTQGCQSSRNGRESSLSVIVSAIPEGIIILVLRQLDKL
jgi:hypothetical protein